MLAVVLKRTTDWRYEIVSIGYPGPALHGRPVAGPRHLGAGWVGFDFARAFKKPVRLVNDAAMKALGSYREHPWLGCARSSTTRASPTGRAG
jgi:polyphosphate glucokinase